MSLVGDWITGKLIKKYAASAIRAALISLATLIATKIPIASELAQVIDANADNYANAIAAGVAGSSLIWSFLEKKNKEAEK
jgi:hypothetical protein